MHQWRSDELLSYRLKKLRHADPSPVPVGETLNQVVTLLNDGREAWPEDTTLILSCQENPLQVKVAIKIGYVPVGATFDVVIPIEMKRVACQVETRFTLEYQLVCTDT